MFQFWMNVGHTTEHYHSKYKSLHLWAFVAFLQKILQIGIWLYHLFTYLLTYLYLHTDLAMMTGLRPYLPRLTSNNRLGIILIKIENIYNFT